MLPATRIDQRKVAEVCRRVRWHGRYFSCLCPFHDDKEPSLLVYDDAAFCMGSCNRQYSLYNVWAKHTHGRTQFDATQVTSPEAVIRWHRVPPLEVIASDGNEVLLRHRAQRQYLISRHLENRIEPQTLGWWTGWITIPVYNRSHEFIGLVLRATPPVEQATNQRYMLPPNQPPLLYVPDWHRIRTACTQNDIIYIVYGMFDALALCELGLPVITFTNGKKGSFSGAALLDDFRTKLYIIPDLEEDDTARALVAKLGWRGKVVPIEYPDDVKDPAAFLEKGKSRLLLNQLARM